MPATSRTFLSSSVHLIFYIYSDFYLQLGVVQYEEVNCSCLLLAPPSSVRLLLHYNCVLPSGLQEEAAGMCLASR
jgi:hypothetical protein